MQWSLALTIETKNRELKLLDAITNDLDRRCYGASPAWGRTVYPDGSQRIGVGAFEIHIAPVLDEQRTNLEADLEVLEGAGLIERREVPGGDEDGEGSRGPRLWLGDEGRKLIDALTDEEDLLR